MSICNTFLTSLCIKSMFSKIQSSIIFGHIGDCQAMKISRAFLYPLPSSIHSLPRSQLSSIPAFHVCLPSSITSLPRSPAFLDPQPSSIPSLPRPQPSSIPSLPRSPACLDPQPAPIKPNIKQRFAFEVAASPAVDSCVTTGASG